MLVLEKNAKPKFFFHTDLCVPVKETSQSPRWWEEMVLLSLKQGYQAIFA